VKAPEPAALQAGEHISVRKRSLRNFPLAAPLIFDVGELPEVTETSGSSPNVTRVDLPVIVNGANPKSRVKLTVTVSTLMPVCNCWRK
jgi:hypothetical protein